MTQTRYEIVSSIGMGASSRVDKAHDNLIDRIVALKTFGHGFGSEELQKQFVREAQILGRLSHPNIVSIYDLGTNEDGAAYLVMEFVPGKTLETVMTTQRALPLSRVGVWAGDLANALNRAHRAGIIHGDVKPANIFVTEDGHIKLGDFGIARFATQLSGSGNLVGTPAYLSPEQIKGETQDHRSDIFSLGIILYQLSTGVRPFDGSSVAAVCAQIVASEPAPPSSHNKELPEEFDRVVMRCLAKDPTKRYASGESLAASLYPFARSKADGVPDRVDSNWWKKPLRGSDAWVAFGTISVAAIAIAFGVHVAGSHSRSHAVTTMASAGGDSATENISASTQTATQTDGLQPQMQNISAQTTIAEFGGSRPQEFSDAPENVRAAGPSKPIVQKKKVAQKPSKPKGAEATRSSVGALPIATEASTRTASTALALSKPVTPSLPARNAQVQLNIEISSAIDGETLAIYADQKLVATSPLSVTAAGETIHLQHPLPSGAHEFRVALYRTDQSLHLERGGLADLQSDGANTLTIKVVRRAKMLVKHDAALEILWPGAVAKGNKPGVSIADASASVHASR
jgi:serine/threonine-protein kinase